MSRLTFFCDLAEATTPLPHFWEHTVGSDHARMALRSDWQRQLKRAHDELGFKHVRFHGILSDDVATLSLDRGKFVYSFFNCDQIFDFLLGIGMRPFVELSFMPSVLASGKRTVFGYEANVTPPKDYKQWSMLIERLVSHLVDLCEAGICNAESEEVCRLRSISLGNNGHRPDDGTLAPWAVAASLPFAPEVVLPSLQRLNTDYPEITNKYGFKCSYNPTFKSKKRKGWVSSGYFGLDQGPIVMMIENYRSGFIWRLMRRCPYIVEGLRRAGFRGGWLG